MRRFSYVAAHRATTLLEVIVGTFLVTGTVIIAAKLLPRALHYGQFLENNQRVYNLASTLLASHIRPEEDATSTEFTSLPEDQLPQGFAAKQKQTIHDDQSYTISVQIYPPGKQEPTIELTRRFIR